MEEIKATYVRTRVQWDDVVVGEAICDDERIAVKGKMDDGHPERGMTYTFYGQWKKYKPRFGPEEDQFAFRSLVITTPHSEAGVIRYLKQAPGIGARSADRIWELFGEDSVRVLRTQPERVVEEIPWLKLPKAMKAALWLQEHKELEDCKIDLMSLLGGRGFPRKTYQELIRRYGNAAAKEVRKNPYRLLKYPGGGFLRADKLYLDLGGNPAKLKRQALCICHEIASDSNGHTWLPSKTATVAVYKSVGSIEKLDVERATELGIRAKLLSSVHTNGNFGAIDDDGNVQWLALHQKASNEAELAALLQEAMTELGWPFFAEDVSGISDHQRYALARALRNGSIAILGGSPGTGKTYTAAALIRTIIAKFGEECVAICAPTGKAAVRMTEAMRAYGITGKTRAYTIHSLLGVRGFNEGDWLFEHTSDNPIDAQFIVVDEMSMCDTDILLCLLRARRNNTKVLFIGDVNQLPPVGHGAPLRDMIGANVPYGELREIQRNAGGIVKACASIRDGRDFRCEGNLELIHTESADEQAQSVLDILEKEEIAGKDPIWDCQTLVAVNEKSPIGRNRLNHTLQRALNRPPVKDASYAPDDKVVCLKNSFYECIEADDDARYGFGGGVYVANGELAQVVDVEKFRFIAELEAPYRLVAIPLWYDDGKKPSWDLAYALTCHKMQGSEAPVIIVIIDEYFGAKWVCNRAWVYTAISRAKERCYLVGQYDTARKFCARNTINSRKTFLRERILQ